MSSNTAKSPEAAYACGMLCFIFSEVAKSPLVAFVATCAGFWWCCASAHRRWKE